jgi:hypothetical protein
MEGDFFHSGAKVLKNRELRNTNSLLIYELRYLTPVLSREQEREALRVSVHVDLTPALSLEQERGNAP